MDDICAIRQSSDYAAASHIPASVQWTPGDGGHILVNKSTKRLFVGRAVVHVYDHKLNCGPNGNFIKTDIGTFERAKFQLYAGKPNDVQFAEDFGDLFSNLKKIENMIATSSHHQDMLFTDLSARMIRFARPIFEKRAVTVANPYAQVYLEDVTFPTGENTAEERNPPMDNETRNWPVEEKYTSALRQIISHYKAVPLRVYKNDVFIEPTSVNETLQNATILISFSMRHTFLPKLKQDTFRANIEQILVLQGGGKLGNEFDNIDVRAGPITFSVPSKRKASTPVASTSKPLKTTKVGFTEPETSYPSQERAGDSMKGKERETDSASRSATAA
ncbi:hypothetical protein L210DRAFT_3506436 [Boletus edulis BED1]|uniref:Uncharacterized protein n=1 Tax=Boletus edulis BED1 TaxID=1328754 RepID=A0AAD4BN97_BOLED|nr:hypothetical protein L210DRAFT_3506436 [Boletus edulis BED1]